MTAAARFTPTTPEGMVLTLTASIERAKALRSTDLVTAACAICGVEVASVRALCPRLQIDPAHLERWCCGDCRERAPGKAGRVVRGADARPPAPVMRFRSTRRVG
jgi:hypothetical protein